MNKARHYTQNECMQDPVAVSFDQETRICRGCLITECRMVNAMLHEASFKHLTSITISPTDGLPQWLCYECSALLQKYSTFRNKVIKSHYRLYEYMLESVPFALDEDATPHLSRTTVLHYEIGGTPSDKPEDVCITKTENREIKNEAIPSDYEDNDVEEYYREEIPEIELASVIYLSDPLDINSAVNWQHEEQAEQVQAPILEPHVGTDAALHLDKHRGVTGSSGHDEERYLADTTSTRHSDNAEEEVEHNIHRDDGVNSSSHCNVQSYTCDTGNKCFSDKNILITHIHKHSVEKSIKCDVCMKSFKRKVNLVKHLRIHSRPSLYKCDVCMKAFKRKKNLEVHSRIHTDEMQYKCILCSKSFIDKAGFKRHFHNHISNRYKCNVCMKCFKSKYKLDVHARKHSGERPYICEVCAKKFTTRCNLDRHLLIHTGEKPYKCDICSKSFNQKCTLDSHMLIHTSEKPYKCDICMKRFKKKHYLDLHTRRHSGEMPYKFGKGPPICAFCTKSFTSKAHLARHVCMKTERPFKCDVCLKCFNTKVQLDVHARLHSDDNPYKCNVCARSFISKLHLDRHIRVHTGEKPYQCAFCTRTFNNESNLNRHVRLHTGEKPYQCDICSKRFIQKVSAVDHIRMHTGERPYKCDICLKAFTRKSDRNVHTRIHSGEKRIKHKNHRTNNS